MVYTAHDKVDKLAVEAIQGDRGKERAKSESGGSQQQWHMLRFSLPVPSITCTLFP